jgi:hypothetical protein
MNSMPAASTSGVGPSGAFEFGTVLFGLRIAETDEVLEWSALIARRV